jgi:hypothetical protein
MRALGLEGDALPHAALERLGDPVAVLLDDGREVAGEVALEVERGDADDVVHAGGPLDLAGAHVDGPQADAPEPLGLGHAVLHLGERLLGRDLLGDVPGDAAEADDPVALVAHGCQGQRHRDHGAVGPDQLGPVVVEPLTGAGPFDELALERGVDEAEGRLDDPAHDVVGASPGEALGGSVPPGDHAHGVDDADGVVAGRDDERAGGQRSLGRHQVGDVADGGDHELLALDLDRAQADVDRELPAIEASADQIAARSHRPGGGIGSERGAVVAVAGRHAGRDEVVHAAPHQPGARVVEHLRGPLVRGGDGAVGTHDEHRVRGRVEEAGQDP